MNQLTLPFQDNRIKNFLKFDKPIELADWVFTCLDCGREYEMALPADPDNMIFPDDEDIWCDVCRGEVEASDVPRNAADL